MYDAQLTSPSPEAVRSQRLHIWTMISIDFNEVASKITAWMYSLSTVSITHTRVGEYGTDEEYQELKKQLQNVKMSLVAEIEEEKELCELD